MVTHSLKDFCTQIPDGNPCLSDVMCQSGYCRGDKGGFRTGVCQPMAQQGEHCEVDADCGNKACARATAKPGALLSCCASGRTQMYAGFHYCSEMADGSTCWSDAMCKSGNCKGNAGGLKRGTCR